MRRITVTVVACAAMLAGVVAARAADTPAAGLLPVTTKLGSCDMSGSDRSAVFLARMDAIPGATRMSMRFQLFEKLGRGAGWDKLDVPALRGWHRSLPGVKTFSYKQTVDALRVGGAYKARVQFHWNTAAGALVDSETRDTPVCRGLLPNLAIGGLDSRSGPTPDTRTYRVTVDNDGKGEADDIDVVLSIDHGLLDAHTIDELDSGDSTTVSFVGPACIHALRVRIDPDNTIGETSEDDNTELFSCPGS
jgi:CARDB